MNYRQHVRDAVQTGGDSLGPKLGRAAVRINFSVVLIAAVTGATRATIYSWFYGNEVSNAYRTAVTRLTDILSDAPSTPVAWSKACKTFRIPQASATASSSASPTMRS
jgi:predicted transcriptional regulator